MKRHVCGPTCQFVQDGKFLYYKHDYKLRKRRNPKFTYTVDRISDLPDEILVCILSRLKLKQAASTSILSRRWRYVWTSTTNLCFDSFRYLTYLGSCLDLGLKLVLEEGRRYVEWVNSVVEQHRGDINQFCARFILDSHSSTSVSSWIQFAMRKRVQTLMLECLTTNFGSFTPASLDSCGYICSQSLKVVNFQNIDVTGQVLEYFLCNCSALERLTVISSQNLLNLRVVGPSAALKHLEIKRCCFLAKLEIRDANVVSIDIDSLPWLLLRNVPLLVDVSLPMMDIAALTELSCCVSQLEILKLDSVDVVNHDTDAFPVFTNLKHLELKVEGESVRSEYLLCSFMKASPYLQRLVLKMKYHRLTENTYATYTKVEAPECPHHHLKVVELVGYRLAANKYIIYLAENAVSLKKIVVDREYAIGNLEGKVPSTIEFVHTEYYP